jgi:flagellar biosynthetic protein FliP
MFLVKRLKQECPNSPPSGRGWGRDVLSISKSFSRFFGIPSPNPSRREGNIVLSVLAVLLFMGGLFFFANPALAQNLSLNIGGPGATNTSGQIVQMVALITILSLAPSILMMVTSFVRIIVSLSLLRTALGIQQTPPNMVLISLALFLTFFIMAPTFQKSYEEGVKPLMEQKIDEKTAFTKTVEPFREFMLRYTRDRDLRLFADIAELPENVKPQDIPLHVLIPSFMISELRRSFEIGFLLFLPFLVIDMVVASILMAMGMMMLPPSVVALPFKIIFFVLVDGWYLVVGSLVKSYGL